MRVSGVQRNKAEALHDAGLTSLDDLRMVPQTVIADVDGIGNALAARIKADVADS